MAYDLLLNEDNDIFIQNGDFVLTSSNGQLLKQRMEITFHTLVGEWYLNTEFGTYNIDLFTNKKLTKAQMDSYFINIIKSFPEVERLLEYVGEFNAFTREYSLRFRVKALGETLNVEFSLLPPGVETLYEETDYKFPPKGCDIADVQEANDFYKLIHIDIPTTLSWS